MEGPKNYIYDVCLSFAGENRNEAAAIANLLTSYNVSVFFDEFKNSDLLGKDLTTYLTDVYSRKSRYCVLLVSHIYSHKKWTTNIELPAARERIYSDGDDYIIPVLLDDTELPGITKTIGHLDLRNLTLAEVSNRIVKKVLYRRYSSEKMFSHVDVSNKNFLDMLDNVQDQELFNIFCYTMMSVPTIEIRFVSFTPLKLLSNKQFQITLEMLIERMHQEGRDGTLRLYCLSPNKRNLTKFTNYSREPKDVLQGKLENSVKMTKALLNNDKLKNKLRLEIIWYIGIPAIQLCQIDKHYFFRSFSLGQKQDSYSVFHVERGIAPEGFVVSLDNLFIDLEFRGEKETINWF